MTHFTHQEWRLICETLESIEKKMDNIIARFDNMPPPPIILRAPDLPSTYDD